MKLGKKKYGVLYKITFRELLSTKCILLDFLQHNYAVEIHFFQRDHKSCPELMGKWIELAGAKVKSQSPHLIQPRI